MRSSTTTTSPTCSPARARARRARPSADPLFMSTIKTFRRLKQNEFALAEPYKIKIDPRHREHAHRRPGEALAAARSTPEELLRLLNDLYPDKEPKPGSSSRSSNSQLASDCRRRRPRRARLIRSRCRVSLRVRFAPAKKCCLQRRSIDWNPSHGREEIRADEPGHRQEVDRRDQERHARPGRAQHREPHARPRHVHVRSRASWRRRPAKARSPSSTATKACCCIAGIPIEQLAREEQLPRGRLPADQRRAADQRAARRNSRTRSSTTR